jgi:acyl carrier protein
VVEQVNAVADIEGKVIDVLRELTKDWDLELPNGLTKDTRLMGDLAFESIDVVQLAVALEQAFDRKGLPFEQLFMQDGDYVEDLRVGQLVDFLAEQV